MAQVVQELLYQIGADVTDLKRKVGEVSSAVDEVKSHGKGIGETLTEEFSKAVTSLGPLSSAIFKFAGVLTGAAGVLAGIEIAKTFVEASFEAQAATARIAAATGATGAKLEELRGEFEAVNVTVQNSEQEVATAIGAVTAKLGLQGEAATGAARTLLQLANVTRTDLGSVLDTVPKIVEGFGGGVEGLVNTADTLNRTVQATGVGLGTLTGILVSSGPALRQLGLDAEQSAALIGALEQSGINAGEAVGSLRIFLTRAAQAGLDAGDAFRQVVERIKNAKTESAALSEAQQTFGRQFVQVADFIRRTGFDLDGFVAKVRQVPGTLADTEAASSTLGIEFAKLGKSIQNLVENAGFITFLRDRVHELGLAVQGLAETKIPSLAQLRGESSRVAESQVQIDAAAKKVKDSFESENAAYAKNTTAAAASAAANAGLTESQLAEVEASKKAAAASEAEAAAQRAKVAGLNAVTSAFEGGFSKQDGFIKGAETANKAGEALAQGLRAIAAQAASQGPGFDAAGAKLKLYQTAVEGLVASGTPLATAQALVSKAIAGIDTTKARAEIAGLRDEAAKPIRPTVDTAAFDDVKKKAAEAKSSGGTLVLTLDESGVERGAAKATELVTSIRENAAAKPVEVKLSDEDATAKLKKFEADAKDAAATPVALKVDTAEAATPLADLQKLLDTTKASGGSIDLRVDLSDATGKAAAAQKALDDLRSPTPIPIQVSDTDALARVAEIEAKLAGVKDTAASAEVKISDTDALARVAEVEAKLAQVKSTTVEIAAEDKTAASVGAAKASLVDLQRDAALAGIEVTKTKNAGGEVVLTLSSAAAVAGANDVRAAVDGVRASAAVPIELQLKIQSEANQFTEQVRKATAEIDIFGSKFAQIPATIGAAFPAIAVQLRGTSSEFDKLATTARAKADQIKKALADGFSESDDHVQALKSEFDQLNTQATIKINADIAPINDALSTISAEISQGAPKLKIDADLSAAQKAIDAERSRIDALPDSQLKIDAEAKLDKAQAEIDKLRQDEQSKPIEIPVETKDNRPLGIGGIPFSQTVGNAATLSELQGEVQQAIGQVAAAIKSGNAEQLAQLKAQFQFFLTTFASTNPTSISGPLSQLIRQIDQAFTTLGTGSERAALTGLRDPVTLALDDLRTQQAQHAASAAQQVGQTNSLLQTGNQIAQQQVNSINGVKSAVTGTQAAQTTAQSTTQATRDSTTRYYQVQIP